MKCDLCEKKGSDGYTPRWKLGNKEKSYLCCPECAEVKKRHMLMARGAMVKETPIKHRESKTKPQIKSNQIKSNQIKSNQIKSNQIKSNQIKSNQIKSNQIKFSRGW